MKTFFFYRKHHPVEVEAQEQLPLGGTSSTPVGPEGGGVGSDGLFFNGLMAEPKGEEGDDVGLVIADEEDAGSCGTEELDEGQFPFSTTAARVPAEEPSQENCLTVVKKENEEVTSP